MLQWLKSLFGAAPDAGGALARAREREAARQGSSGDGGTTFMADGYADNEHSAVSTMAMDEEGDGFGSGPADGSDGAGDSGDGGSGGD